MQTKLFTFVFKRAAQSLTSLAMLFVMLLINQSELKAQAYTAGDTSVCRSQTVTYTFSGAGLTFTVLGGGTITATSANTVTVAWGSVAGVYMIRVVGASTIFQNVIVEGDVALACDALVNVSLDGNCRAVITPETMLEGAPFPESSYSVTVYDENNNVLPANTVTYSYLGKTLRVLVRHLCSGVTCWGRIYIEDKYIPNLLCDNRADTINCGQGYTPEALSTLVGFSGLAFPLPSSAVITPHADGQVGHYTVTGFDLCCAVDLRYYDVYNKYNCTTPYYASVYRFWYAEDCKGNKTNCSDTIYIRRGTLNAVVCPDNYDGFTHPALKCKDKEPATGPYPRGWNALDNGNPSPYNYYNATGSLIWYGTGAPANTGCDHLAVSFRDVKIPVCGESFKVLRNWKIFDWCTGTYSECNQLIKVADAEAPVITCPQNGQVFGTDYYSCIASSASRSAMARGVNPKGMVGRSAGTSCRLPQTPSSFIAVIAPAKPGHVTETQPRDRVETSGRCAMMSSVPCSALMLCQSRFRPQIVPPSPVRPPHAANEEQASRDNSGMQATVNKSSYVIARSSDGMLAASPRRF